LRALASISMILVCALTAGAQEPFVLAYLPQGFGESSNYNDATAHYRSGEANLKHAPRSADASFLWASRLNPTWALPLYGRAIAQERLWFEDAFLAAYSGERPSEPSRAQLHLLDSLMFGALTLDPFLDRRIDRLLQQGRERQIHWRVRLGGKKVNLPDEVGLGNEEFMEQDYIGATENWGKALKEMPDLLMLHSFRAEAFYARKRYDSTVIELQALTAKLQKREEKDLVYEFQSKAMAIYATAVAQVQLGELKAARETFEQALTENLGLYMAHVRLAGLSLMTGDTTSAVTELGAATQLNDADAGILFQYGFVLIAADHDDSATVMLRKSIKADPYFAMPYEFLGRVLDAHGKKAEAILAYQGFIDHAARDDNDLPWAVERVVQLSREVAGKK
jgi:Tfp pilus assembly protein PilF